MSDIVNPRIDSFYLHPKKYAWRPDSKIFNPDQNIPEKDEENIASAIHERFKMVISNNFKIQNGTIETQSPIRNHLSQDVPLDFSVKTVINSQKTKLDLPILSTERDNNISPNISPNNSDEYSNFSNDVPIPVSSCDGKVSSSQVPIYNGSQKFQRPKQRHLHRSSPISHIEEHYSKTYRTSETGANHIQVHDSNTIQSDSAHHTHIQNFNQRIQESTLDHREEQSFKRENSPTLSPKYSRENGPDSFQYKGSILHEALARTPGEKSQTIGCSSYKDKSNLYSTCTKPSANSLTPPIVEPNSSIPQANLIAPDTSSVLPPVSTLMPGTNPLMPIAFFNGMGFPPSAMNGMNPFGNGSILSPSLDTRIPQTPTSGDKKLGKPIRPFKAITNELLYGMPTMGLPAMNPVIHNGGYFRDYIQATSKETNDLLKSSPVPKKESPEMSTNSAMNSSPPCSSNNGNDHKLDVAGSGDSNCSYAECSGSTAENAESTSNSRKRTRTLPEDLKDEAYWERRRKNNQAAKRSRDARRQKEDMVAQQAWLFREQNIQLRFQITGLEETHQRLQIQYRAVTEQSRNLELQLRLANEKLARNRCGKCGSRIENNSGESNYSESLKNE